LLGAHVISEPANEKITRLCKDYVNGALAGAELELHEWARHQDCPREARVLLASALVCRGRHQDALSVLHPQIDLARHQFDEQLGKMLIAVLIEADMIQSAQRVAGLCYHQLGRQGQMVDWLEAVDAPGFGEPGVQPEATIEELAQELTHCFDLIPSLVAAQQVQSDLNDTTLLRDALFRMTPHTNEHSQSLTLSLSLARLSLLLEDYDEARRWAYRGLRLDPLNASLALILAQVRGDAAMGPDSTQVLCNVADAFPDYPDVQAAAIRCEQAAGHDQRARLRLSAWLARDPGQSLARELAREMEEAA
jgi:hypothetical protein